MTFEFATAARIVFGPGSVRELETAAASMGRRALLVTGRRGDFAGIAAHLPGGGPVFPVPGEPGVGDVREGAARARDAGCDLVVALGGGSAIDAGKAIASLMANGGDPLDYLEVVGKGCRITKPSAPFIAVPTTAGTGAEVTRNAVLASPEHKVKASLRSAYLLPRLAIVDPELTLSLPPAITAATGLDALTQLIEPYVSPRANAVTDLYAREGLRRAARSLVRAFENGGDLQAREDMAFASLMGGLSLANAGLGAVHGFAAPAGGMFDAPHGAVCAALLPHVMDANLAALKSRSPGSEAIGRYGEVARLLTGRSGASAGEGVEWVRRTAALLRIPGLGAYGVTTGHIPALVESAAKASSMKANPVVLEPGELERILTAAL